MRENLNPQNRQLAEELVPVGNLISPQLLINDTSDKCFIMQAGNIITLPAFIESTAHTIDVATMLRVLYSANATISLDKLTDDYLLKLGEGAPAKSEDIMDSIMGILTMSQAGAPVKSITHHPMTWRSRSLVPRFQILDQCVETENLTAHHIYLSAQMNPDLSIWDHYDSLTEQNMTSSQSMDLQQRVSEALVELIRCGAVYVNVPSSVYNQ